MKKLSLLLLLSAVPLVSAQSLAGHHGGCCESCGCQCPTRKVCHWKCEMKEVKDYEWKCECEDFCIPGPSPHCRVEECGECADCCNDCCDDCCGCGHDCVRHLGGCLCHKKKWGAPCGCCVRTKKKLIRVDVVKQVPVYTCVIEEVCDRCCGNGACGNGACGNGSCVGGAVPPPGVPMDSSEVAPPSDAPMPPMPPQAGKQPTKKRLNPILTAFMPASR
jgi:hypothetical protein